MVVSPDDASKLSQEEIESITKAELDLDATLLKEFRKFKTIKVREPISSLSVRAQKELLRRYRKAGWYIQEGYFSGTDDGLLRCSDAYSYWNFSEKLVGGDDSLTRLLEYPGDTDWR